MYRKFKMFYSMADNASGGSAGITSEQVNNETKTGATQTESQTKTQAEPEQTKQTKTYSEEEITKMNEKFEANKQIAIEEALKKAKMTSDEKTKYEQEQKLKQIEEREKQISLRELKADTIKMLSDESLPTEIIDLVVGDDKESTSKNIKNFKTVFDKAVQAQVEQRLKGKTPVIGNISSNSNTIAEQFRRALG